jgi:hypothetical protein
MGHDEVSKTRIELAMVKPPRPTDDDERSPEETVRIRERTLKRILNTPPKRHAEMLKERRAAKKGHKK